MTSENFTIDGLLLHAFAQDQCWHDIFPEFRSLSYYRKEQEYRTILTWITAGHANGQVLPIGRFKDAMHGLIGLSTKQIDTRLEDLMFWNFITVENKTVDRRLRPVLPTPELLERMNDLICMQKMAIDEVSHRLNRACINIDQRLRSRFDQNILVPERGNIIDAVLRYRNIISKLFGDKDD